MFYAQVRRFRARPQLSLCTWQYRGVQSTDHNHSAQYSCSDYIDDPHRIRWKCTFSQLQNASPDFPLCTPMNGFCGARSSSKHTIKLVNKQGTCNNVTSHRIYATAAFFPTSQQHTTPQPATLKTSLTPVLTQSVAQRLPVHTRHDLHTQKNRLQPHTNMHAPLYQLTPTCMHCFRREPMEKNYLCMAHTQLRVYTCHQL